MTTTDRAIQVIEAARDAHRRPRLSVRQAAQRAGMSDSLWRHIVHGRQSARPEQLLDMAWAVGALDEVAKIIHASDVEVAETVTVHELRAAGADQDRVEIVLQSMLAEVKLMRQAREEQRQHDEMKHRDELLRMEQQLRDVLEGHES